MKKTAQKFVGIWLIIGLIMVFFQVIIGGVTRLTDSGLSITEWKVILGAVPPTNEAEWQVAFDQYKTHAKQQYESLHSDMSLKEFKGIYFWEWLHRNWARLMSLVFLFPFLFFLIKKWLPKWLIGRLTIVILLAGLAGAMGWIMVASGLNEDNRTWVSAYKLVAHLSIATLLFAYLFWTVMRVLQPTTADFSLVKGKKWSWIIVLLLFLQIMIGGLMAGMRAGLIHPHWPFFMGNNYLFEALGQTQSLSTDLLINYEPSVFIKAAVQILHRTLASILVIASIAFTFFTIKKDISLRLEKSLWLMLIILAIQFGLGVFTVLAAFPKVPVGLGTAHQGVALLLLATWLRIAYQFRKG
ncbi:MAG: COX15/CtaA family protein [Chitinophagales bacterium]